MRNGVLFSEEKSKSVLNSSSSILPQRVLPLKCSFFPWTFFFFGGADTDGDDMPPLTMDRKTSGPYVKCACWNSHVTKEWKDCSFLCLAFPCVTFLTVLLPYILVVSQGILPAVFPIISICGGLPPMSGIFSAGLLALGFLGVIGAPLIFETIKHRNVERSKIVFWSNKALFVSCFVITLGAVVTASCSLCFMDVRNKLEWFNVVFIPHASGASMVLAGAYLFQFTFTIVFCFLPDPRKSFKFTTVAIQFAYIIIFFSQIGSFHDGVKEMSGFNEGDAAYLETIKPVLPTKFSSDYIVLSVCEWAVVFLLALQFGLGYTQMKRVSLRVVIRHKTCFNESPEVSPNLGTMLH